MSHECPECGQMCYCDGEDTYNPYAAEECLHSEAGECDIMEAEDANEEWAGSEEPTS